MRENRTEAATAVLAMVPEDPEDLVFARLSYAKNDESSARAGDEGAL